MIPGWLLLISRTTSEMADEDADGPREGARGPTPNTASSVPLHPAPASPEIPPVHSAPLPEMLRHRPSSAKISSPQPSQTSPTANSEALAPHHDYYQRLHQWIWTYQWQKFCWEQHQKEWRDRYFWQYWQSMGNAAGQAMGMMGAPTAPTQPHPQPGPVHGVARAVPMPGGHGVQIQQMNGNPLNIPMAAAGHPQIFVGAVGPNNQIDPSWKGFKTAPIWKRVTAEIIDIALLMLLKLFVTYTLFDMFDVFFLDLKKYQDLLNPDTELSADLALDLASELMMMEFAHRLISCFYEIVMTITGFPQGGATYGKKFMGLRVVTCSEYILLDGMVLVKPAETPTLKQATVRAVLKNYSWAIVVPLPLTVFLNRERRAMYDTACKCMVVEAGNTMMHRFIRR